MEQATRSEFVRRLADAISSVTATHPLRVAIGGPPASGKTTLADELAVVLGAQDRGVIRATIDDFLVPRARRYSTRPVLGRRPRLSTRTTTPRCAGSCSIRWARTETARSGRPSSTATPTPRRPRPATTAPADAVLLFDGVFLLRPELVDRWDLRIFVSVPFEQTVGRAKVPRHSLGQDPPATPPIPPAPRGTTRTAEIEQPWRNRYIPAQQLYFATAHPTDHADIIVYNDQLERPTWDVRPHSPIHRI
ncbi:uridylate kinase [Yinghuangia aomiensis]